MGSTDDSTPGFFSSMSETEKSAAREASRELIGSGGTSLHVAAAFGHISFAKKCIADGVDLNALDSHGSSAVYYAVKYDHAEMLHFLLNAGAAPE